MIRATYLPLRAVTVILTALLLLVTLYGLQDLVSGQATANTPITPQLRRTGVDAGTGLKRANPAQGSNVADSYWSINRVYNDAGVPNTCQGSNGSASAMIVREYLGEDYAGYLFGGNMQGFTNESYPYEFTSASARWISRNWSARHSGDGWYHRVALAPIPGQPASDPNVPGSWHEGCWDPSSQINTPQQGGGANMGSATTWVFRSQTINIYGPGDANAPGIDLSKVKINLEGLVDNWVGVTINNNPLECSGGNVGAEQGGRDPIRPTIPARPFGTPYLPMCVTGFGNSSRIFDTVSPGSDSITGTPFVYGANTVDIHVKSAYTHMGMILTEARVAGAGLACSTTTSTSIQLRYTIGGGRNARIVRVGSPSVMVGATLNSNGTGTRTNLSLSAGTTYTFQLRDESNTGDILAEVQCSTPVPQITIQGTVKNAHNRNIAYESVGIDYNCDETADVTTDAVGNYSFTLSQGTGYCIRVVSGRPTGWSATYIRPWNVSNDSAVDDNYTSSCPAHGNDSYLYCSLYFTYEWQVAGVHNTQANSWGTYDRSVDIGLDLVLVVAPAASCSVTTNPSSTNGVEISERFTVNITITNSTASGQTINSTSHPLVVTGPGLTGLSNPAYGDVTPGTSVAATAITNVYSDTPGMYTITVDIENSTTTPCTVTVPIGNKSYLKVYGGDVWAGGGFIPSCGAASGSGDIYGFARPVGGGNYAGASAQFTVTALLTVREFYSVSMRAYGNGNTFPPKGLTFANTGSTDANTTYGGGFNSGGRCMTDYWGTTGDPSLRDVGAFSGSSPSFALGRHQYVNNSSLNIDTNPLAAPGIVTVPNRAQTAIFVNGNVLINENIHFSTAARGSRNDIPYLVIIARGNIYIDNDVSRIDAMLIAQPNGASGGTIYTCTRRDGTLNSAAQLYSECSGRQLVINGGLFAKSVKFQRVFGTLKDAGVMEPADSSNFASGTGTNAGEVINFSPELYLAPSPLKRPSEPFDGASGGPYQAISGLPPIF